MKNQKSQHFDANLAKRSHHCVSEWLDILQSLCVSDMVKAKSLLRTALDSSRNCFNFVLYVIEHADFDGGEKSLAYVTLVEFEAWLESKTEGMDIQKVEQQGYCPSNEQRDLALELVVSSKFLLFELVRRTFKLNSADNSFLTKHVEFLITRREYKEVKTIYLKILIFFRCVIFLIQNLSALLNKEFGRNLEIFSTKWEGCSSTFYLTEKFRDNHVRLSIERINLVVFRAP